jgi:hypothetical protein
MKLSGEKNLEISDKLYIGEEYSEWITNFCNRYVISLSREMFLGSSLCPFHGNQMLKWPVMVFTIFRAIKEMIKRSKQDC